MGARAEPYAARMADTDVWDVVIEEPVDGADRDDGADRLAIVKKTEVEARQAFAEGVSIAPSTAI